MQPVHCVLQHHVANLHVSTHMATKRDTNHAAIPLCNHSFHQLPKHPVTTHRRTTTCCRTESRNRFDDETIATATATHRRYLSSPAAATLHGKTQGFVLRLPPQHKPHATFMQPLQCVLQHHVANLHVSTHMAIKRDTNHAAIHCATTASISFQNTL